MFASSEWNSPAGRRRKFEPGSAADAQFLHPLRKIPRGSILH
jgi:hypothetical protein